MPEIVWKAGAENDLLRVFADLEQSHPGAGEQFVLKLDATLQLLKAHPKSAPLFDPPMRRLVVGITGFGLFYTVEARGLIVHALVHLRQDPALIRTRVRELLDLD